MGTSSNIRSLILLSALSSSILPVSYEINRSITPSIEATYKFDKATTWDYREIDNKSNFELNNRIETEKMNIILSFSKELVDNLTEMDSEFIEIVNSNFWDLL